MVNMIFVNILRSQPDLGMLMAAFLANCEFTVKLIEKNLILKYVIPTYHNKICTEQHLEFFISFGIK